jgi:putative ABC transport system substrate-binding protein
LIGVLFNPQTPDIQARLTGLQEAARAVGQRIHVVYASTEAELDAAFATFAPSQAGALLVGSDPFFNSRRNQIVALAARHAIPAIYEGREYALAGGLVSYGTSLAEGYRQVGIYTGRVLKGEKPADLPVVQSTKFEFVINLKTAKAPGLDVPPGFSARADEVIE